MELGVTELCSLEQRYFELYCWTNAGEFTKLLC